MVYNQDSTQSFTITLTALLEGRGIVQYITINNHTQDIIYNYDVSLGTWDALPQGVEGDSMSAWVYIINNGDTTDIIYAEFYSADVTPIPPYEELIHEETLDVGVAKWFFPWSFIMSASNVNITINAGHVTPA